MLIQRKSIALSITVFAASLVSIGCGDGPGNSTPGTVTDIDGNVYQTVTIGTQVWMAENLKVLHFRNGDPIAKVTDDNTWNDLSTAACCEYENSPAHAATYGRIYNWHSVDDSRGIAPEGWHVPSDEEWKQLEMYLGMSRAEADGTLWRGSDEGDKLKQAGTTHWIGPNDAATNESGFTALPGGYRGSLGVFLSIGSNASFWTATEENNNAWVRGLVDGYSQVWRRAEYKPGGLYVRCVRD